MATSGSLSDGGPESPRNSIYERPDTQASRSRDGATTQFVTGAAVGTAAAFLLGDLGLPHIFGYNRFTLIIPLFFLGGVTGLTRFRKPVAWMTIMLLGFTILLGSTALMREPVKRLTRSDPIPQSADAIVVLSAGVTADGLLQQQGLDRLLKGVELSRAGISKRIVLTRERKKVNGKWITSATDQNRVIAIGGGADVTSTGLVTSTREEALRVREMAERGGWKRIIVVTSPLHSRRACATFEHVGLTVSCVPADSRDIAVRNLVGRDNNLRAFGMWIYELAGTLRYWQAGWI